MPYSNKINHVASLFSILLALWLLLSGHYTPLLLGLGGLSILLVLVISLKMGLIEYDEPELLLQAFKWPPYVLWLLKEILKSNIDVCRRILNPKLPISPRLITLKSSQQTNLSRVVYANSITLTPGTISIDIEGDDITVHSLSKSSADGLMTNAMDQQVSKFELKR